MQRNDAQVGVSWALGFKSGQTHKSHAKHSYSCGRTQIWWDPHDCSLHEPLSWRIPWRLCWEWARNCPASFQLCLEESSFWQREASCTWCVSVRIYCKRSCKEEWTCWTLWESWRRSVWRCQMEARSWRLHWSEGI